MLESSKSRKRDLQLREAEEEGVCETGGKSGGESVVNGGGGGSEEEGEGSPRDLGSEAGENASEKKPKSKACKVKVRRKTSSAVYTEEEKGESSLQDSIDGTAGEVSAEDKGDIGQQQQSCEGVEGLEKMDSFHEEGEEKMEEYGSPQEKVGSLGEKGEEECCVMVESVEGSAREKKAMPQELSVDEDVAPVDVNSDSTEPQPSSSVKESDQGRERVMVSLTDENPIGTKRKRRRKRGRSRSKTPSTNAEEDSTEEDEEEDNSRSATSRSATPAAALCSAVLTDTMVEEEERLREREGSEESEQRGEVQKLKSMVEQQRFSRLQHLLKQSNIYSRFLLKRMEEQRKQQEKKDQQRRERAQRKRSIRANKEVSGPQATGGGGGARVTRLSLKSPSLKSPPTPIMTPPSDKQAESESAKGKGSGKRGKKRKGSTEEEDHFKLSDFMDNQGKLKQMKLCSGKGAVTSNGQVKGKTLTLSSAEDLEERYFNGTLVPHNQPRLVTGGIMRSYQLEGMEWIKSLYENGVNGILGDEMGLGKTLQCISFIAYLIEKGVKGPFLVAAPLSTVPNWVAEFKRFAPKVPVVLYHGSATEREDIRRKMFANSRVNKTRHRSRKKAGSPSDEPLLPVVVTSYEICMRDQHYLENRSWKFLVVDEGHRIKNLNCKLIKALKQYDAGNRLLLTGTPLQNNLSELWSLLNFLLPNIFNDLNSFQSWFDFDTSGEDDVRERIIAQEKEQHVLGTLHQILTPFLLRRLKTDVEFSLPPKKEILVYAPLTSYQEEYYKSLLDRTIFDMLEKKQKREGKKKAEKAKEEEEEEGEGEEGKKKRRRKSVSKYSSLNDDEFEAILNGEKELEELCPSQQQKEKKVKVSVTNIKMTSVFMMLRKCCNHPYLLEFPLTEEGEFRVDQQIVECCGKVMVLDRMLPALIKQGHKTLIFSQFTSMLDILEDYLELRGLVYSRLDGTMAFSERERQMTLFRESPDCMIFLLSTRAGGLGINLTSADTVIIYDSDWNPQADLQAQDRCHRIGQTHTVMVYRLVTANTIDQRIVERAATKRRLEKMVIHKGKFKGLSSNYDLSIDDLIDLLHSVDHDKVVSSSDAVISDEALEALLDRSMQLRSGIEPAKSGGDSLGSFRAAGGQEGDVGGGSSSAGDHSDVFKVIAERDSSGEVSSGGGGGGMEGGNTCDNVAVSATTTGCGSSSAAMDSEFKDATSLEAPPTISSPKQHSDSSSTTTPEPASSANNSLKSSFSLSTNNSEPDDSLKSASSTSISDWHPASDQIMDASGGSLTADSALALSSCSSTPEPPPPGGVVLANTDVKVCCGSDGDVGVDAGGVGVSTEAAGPVQTS